MNVISVHWVDKSIIKDNVIHHALSINKYSYF